MFHHAACFKPVLRTCCTSGVARGCCTRTLRPNHAGEASWIAFLKRRRHTSSPPSRLFGSTAARNNIQQDVIHDSSEPPLGIKIRYTSKNERKPKDPTLTEEDGMPQLSTIRDELRSWSEQKIAKDKTKPLQITRDNVPITTLPDSFFEDDVDEDFMEFDEEQEDYYNSMTSGVSKSGLKAGDLVVVTLTGLHRQFGCYLGVKEKSGQFLLADGRWAMGWVRDSRTAPTVLNFATADEVAAIKTHLPTKPILYKGEAGMKSVVTVAGDLPPEVTQSLTTRISDVHDEAIAFRRENVAILDDPYEMLAHEDQYVKLDLAQIVQNLFGKNLSDLNKGARVAVHTSLTRHMDKIILRRNTLQDIDVILAPRRLVKLKEVVMGWARDYQECAAQAARGQNVNTKLRENPLNTFIEKSRRLILKSRKTRSPTTLGVLGPSSARVQNPGQIELIPNGESFSDDDKKIIEFVWDTLLRLPLSMKRGRAASVGSMILRAVGAYPNMRLGRVMGRLFLQEIGTLPPWSEFSDERVYMPIPGRRGADVADHLFAQSEKVAVDLGFREEASHEPVPMVDRYKHLRKDWGDTEVFLIDSAGSTTLDDGISIEASDIEADAYWLHVHTAHPAAFFTPDHIFGKRSSHFGQSIYSSRAVYPMLPFSAATTMSIGRDKEVLTVSTLVLSSGEVKDIKVSLGIVHNTVRLDSSDVEAMDGEKAAEQALLIVGPNAFGRHGPPLPTLDDINQHGETLKKMRDLVRRRARHRQQSVPDAPSFWRPTSVLDHSISSIEDWDKSRLFESYQFAGDPSIKISGSRGPEYVRVSDDLLNIGLVEGSMILAGESLGRWLTDRNVPAIYNGATTSEEWPLWRLNKADKYDDFTAAVATISSTPIPHPYMAVKEYCRVTSPLRRFADLINQWQTTSILDHEASNTSTPTDPQPTETTADPSTPRTDLMFTKPEIDAWISSHLETQKAINTLNVSSYNHWTLQALFRAHHFRAAALPPLFDVQVFISRVRSSKDREESGMKGVLWPFKITASFLKSEERFEDKCARGQFLPCRIMTVDVMKQEVRVRAVAGPSWEMTQNDEKGWVVKSEDGDGDGRGGGDGGKEANGENAEGKADSERVEEATA